MRRVSLLGVAVALLGITATSRADFSTGFESPTVPGGGVPYINYTPTSGPLAVGNSGFNVVSGGVDIVAAPYAVYAGSQALDTIGTSDGASSTIVATFTLAAGSYNFNFEYSINVFPSSTQTSYTATSLATLVAGTASVIESVSKTNTSGTQFIYSGDNVFTLASSQTVTLSFVSSSTGVNAGIILDNINVTSVPEPTSMALLGLGAVGAMGMIRRRKTA